MGFYSLVNGIKRRLFIPIHIKPDEKKSGRISVINCVGETLE